MCMIELSSKLWIFIFQLILSLLYTRFIIISMNSVTYANNQNSACKSNSGKLHTLATLSRLTEAQKAVIQGGAAYECLPPLTTRWSMLGDEL